VRKREINRENQLYERGRSNDREDWTKIDQSQAGTAMALFKNHCERGEEVKKVKV